MYNIDDLQSEARESFDKVWFIQSIEVIERTDQTLAIRLNIKAGLFVQAFIGEITGSLYFALIEGRQRIFGIDLVSGEWHRHPFGNPQRHETLTGGLGDKPLLSFLARVEELLLDENLF